MNENCAVDLNLMDGSFRQLLFRFINQYLTILINLSVFEIDSASAVARCSDVSRRVQ